MTGDWCNKQIISGATTSLSLQNKHQGNLPSKCNILTFCTPRVTQKLVQFKGNDILSLAISMLYHFGVEDNNW